MKSCASTPDRYSLAHLADSTLLRDLAALVAEDRCTTAALLAHIAEVDRRQLYREAAYPSMHAYCVGELRLSEDSAYKRIQAARAGRRFPAILPAIADGRLHLTGVGILVPHLNEDNAEELLAAAENKTKAQIDHLIAERFPQPDVPTLLREIPAPGSAVPSEGIGDELQLAPAQVDDYAQPVANTSKGHPDLEPEESRRGSLSPLGRQRYALQVTISRTTHDRLRHAQGLIGHALPSHDLAGLLDRALAALVEKLEKRKFAATAKPRGPRADGGKGDPRHIPANVKRAVWERDGGRCTFVSEKGRRCEACRGLEFDHVLEAARGGTADVTNLRLRCRAHNQLEAERTFGAGFMQAKRAAADDLDVVPWLRQLGFRAEEAKRAAGLCEHLADAPLAERVRFALASLGRARAFRGRVSACSGANP